MREPVGIEREQNAGEDREQAERDPGGEQPDEVAHRRHAPDRLRAHQRVDDAAKKNGFRELRAGERDVGAGEHDAKAFLAAEKREHAGIDLEEGHGANRRPVWRRNVAGSRRRAIGPTAAS